MNSSALFASLVVVSRLASRWKYAILASLVVAAVAVPSSDIKSMFLYAAPILALSVGGVWLVQRSAAR